MAKSLEKQLNLISPSLSGLPVSDGLIILESISIFIEFLLQRYTVKIRFYLLTIVSHFCAVSRAIHYEPIVLSISTSYVTE